MTDEIEARLDRLESRNKPGCIGELLEMISKLESRIEGLEAYVEKLKEAVWRPQ